MPVDEEDKEGIVGAGRGIEGIELCRGPDEEEEEEEDEEEEEEEEEEVGPLTTSEDGDVDCFDRVTDEDTGNTDPASTLLEVDGMVAADMFEVARPAARTGSDVGIASRCISR